ncbi:MAG TPA: hypothetical protein VLU47_18935 [Blastocatellia bacterium]|nr:hypothetical protein [Blastocatellia bacterium]
MKTTILISVLLLLVRTLAVAQSAQDAVAPVGKQEILSMLKQSEKRQPSQADIAAEVDRRGIDFSVDEETRSELRRAGARTFLLDAIDRAARKEVPALVSEPQSLDEEAEARAQAGAADKLPLLEQARIHALQFAEELPNFIVTQTVTRYLQTPDTRNWQLQDKLEVELSYRIGKGEVFKLLRVNGAPARQSYEELGGSTSTGEFGSTLAGLFWPETRAEFREVKRETFRGRPTVVFDFKVRRANSRTQLTDKGSGQKTVAGYSGSIWIDTESKRVLRMEDSADEIPAGFPVSLSENAIEYEWATIAGERYLLPIRAEVLLGRDSQKVYTRNVIEFRDYRKFEGTIKLDPN